MSGELSSLARWLLWQHDRGSLAYDMLCLIAALFLLFAPAALLHDPLAGVR